MLGYGNKLTTALPVVMDDHRIGVLTFADLVSQLKNEDYIVEYYWESDDSSQRIAPEILHSLEASAKGENPLAHYALALHYDDSDEVDEDKVSTDYWYKQMQSGRVLIGVEKEFALAYLKQLTAENKYQFHLREAARFGSELAQLDLAEHFDDHAFFKSDHRDVDADPMRVADIARQLYRSEDYRYWLMVAAETGNVDAMRELIKSYEKDDLLRCWTWIYLSRLLGKDLTQNNHYAIHDDGSLYDDDVGGAMHVAGEEGVDLPPLASELDSLARVNAENLFKRINN